MALIDVSSDTPITALARVGPKAARDFDKLGIHTVRDLILHFPFRHEDFSRIVPAGKLKIGERATLYCQVMEIKNQRSPRKRRQYSEGLFEDESGSVRAVWFNQPYISKMLRRGDWVYLAGTLEESYFGLHLTNPVFERAEPNEQTLHAGRLVPIYSTRGGLTSRQIRTHIAPCLPLARDFLDSLPAEIRSRNNFPNLSTAIHDIHFPDSYQKLEAARRRLSFDELFRAQLMALAARHKLDRMNAPAVPFDEAATKTFVASLPFSLTTDQRKSAWAILRDMSKPRPMNRLLEGDVGSGKTVVATIAILNAALAGFRTLYLAPTEILATQHANTISRLLKGFPTTIGLLTSSLAKYQGATVTRAELEEKISSGEVTVLIGTHALLEKGSRPANVGLVIVDEQHRFGVEQRQRLRTEKRPLDAARGREKRKELWPHLLSMTATPIPRTLALTVYGDLDISMLRELPSGRIPIVTKLVRESERNKTYSLIRNEINAGRQGFCICPLVSESDKLGVRAATAEFEKLKSIFPDFKLGLLHGKLKSDEKQKVMEEFSSGKINLLVATAVVEVGIDVPNATIMIIEGADRFGLAQLHQFRGRIGRGIHASQVFLFTETDSMESRERLLTFTRTNDGFTLAEHDLKTRGPGQIFGLDQSGFPEFKIANFQNLELLELARLEAENLTKNDPELTNYPALRDQLKIESVKMHLE